MELKHSFTVPASKADTWSTFEDIESVAGCFPGATVTSVEGDDFKGSCKVKLGPIALTYNGSGTFVDKDESAGRFVVEAKGKDKRGNGTAGATVTATFTEEGSSTRVDVATDLAITGKPAQFGRGVIQDVSDKLLQQFVTCLESKVGSSGGASDAAPAAGAPAPAAAASAGAPAAESPSAVDAPTAAPATPAPAASAAPAATSPVETPPPTRPTPTTPAAAPIPSTPGSASPAVASASPAAGSGPSVTAPRSQSTPGESASRGGQDDALDLGSTVLPVLAKAYGKQIAAGLGLLLVGYLLGRRGR
jgi:carbon monoxide dehydrogenase subunit G